MSSRPLRVALLLDSPVVDHWILELVEFLITLKETTLEAVVFQYSEKAKSPSPTPALYRLYRYFDSKRAIAKQSKQNITSILGETLQLTFVPQGGTISRPDTDRLERLELDVIIDCGWGAVAQTLAPFARLGVWGFHFGGHPLNSCAALGFWEVFMNLKSSSVTLSAHTRHGLDFDLGTQSIRTHKTSPFLNSLAMKRSVIALVAYQLARFANFSPQERDDSSFFKHLPEHQISNSLPNSYPSTSELLRFFLSNLLNILWGRIEGRYRVDQWTIGLTSAPFRDLCAGNGRTIKWLPTAENRFVADPFLVTSPDGRFLFVEEFNYLTRLGHISVAEIFENGEISKFTSVLEREFHLSFPFVFNHEGKFYMVPEQASTNQVTLYEATSFPHSWKEKQVLLGDFPGVDSVLFQHANKWWLFSTYGRFNNQDNNLHLFFADSPFGPFTPHPRNPIKLTLSNSRMAGNIIVDGDRLIRPAQDCLRRYGSSIVFNEITKLSESEYEERAVGELKPLAKSEFKEGLHTISISGPLTAVTGLRYISDPRRQALNAQTVSVEPAKPARI